MSRPDRPDRHLSLRLDAELHERLLDEAPGRRPDGQLARTYRARAYLPWGRAAVRASRPTRLLSGGASAATKAPGARNLRPTSPRRQETLMKVHTSKSQAPSRPSGAYRRCSRMPPPASPETRPFGTRVRELVDLLQADYQLIDSTGPYVGR